MLLLAILGGVGNFANPYRAQEHGLNENSNGLIGQYVPKGVNFDLLNYRPRKGLAFYPS